MAEESKRTAAYLPWATFKSALDQLALGIPSRIDRSVFPGLAWNVQTQLFIAMKFLGLLSSEDEPTPLLATLVAGTVDERKKKLKQVIEASYEDLLAIDLSKASKAHFEETLGKLYNVTGDTRVKAVRFFINAATHTGIPLSTFISPPTNGAPNSQKRRSAPRPKSALKKPIPPNPPPPVVEPPAGGYTKTIPLSNGTLTVTSTANFFALDAADRQFLSTIIDNIEAHLKTHK